MRILFKRTIINTLVQCDLSRLNQRDRLTLDNRPHISA